MKYNTRYIKEYYVVRKIRKELYERLIKYCGENSINLCLRKVLDDVEKNILVSNIGNQYGIQYGNKSIAQQIKKSEKGLDKFMK